MTTPSTRRMRVIACGIMAAALITAAGLAGGYYAYKTAAFLPSATLYTAPIEGQVTEKPDNTAPERRSANHTVYDVSPPSRGTVLKTVPLAVARQDGGRFISGILPADLAGDVNTGQQALLYKDSGELADIGAVVTSVTPAQKDTEHVSVIMLIDEEPSPQRIQDANGTDARRAEIILDKITGAQRLPLSAIVRKNGAPYLWEVVKNAVDGRKAYLKRTNLLMSHAGMAVIDTPSSQSNVFVLNPDEALHDGDAVTVREIFYEGPEQTDDQKLAYALEARTPRHISDTYKGPDVVYSCGGETPENPEQANALDDFITKVRTLAVQQQSLKTYTPQPAETPNVPQEPEPQDKTDAVPLPPLVEKPQPAQDMPVKNPFGTAPSLE